MTSLGQPDAQRFSGLINQQPVLDLQRHEGLVELVDEPLKPAARYGRQHELAAKPCHALRSCLSLISQTSDYAHAETRGLVFIWSVFQAIRGCYFVWLPER
jgi:hypothetical protein